jgi:hypothetical protein
VTTTAVLTEVADGLARSGHRGALRRIIASFRAIESHEIVAMNDALFAKGVELYDARRDKRWSLTDCISCSARLSLATITTNKPASKRSCNREQFRDLAPLKVAEGTKVLTGRRPFSERIPIRP